MYELCTLREFVNSCRVSCLSKPIVKKLEGYFDVSLSQVRLFSIVRRRMIQTKIYCYHDALLINLQNLESGSGVRRRYLTWSACLFRC